MDARRRLSTGTATMLVCFVAIAAAAAIWVARGGDPAAFPAQSALPGRAAAAGSHVEPHVREGVREAVALAPVPPDDPGARADAESARPRTATLDVQLVLAAGLEPSRVRFVVVAHAAGETVATADADLRASPIVARLAVPADVGLSVGARTLFGAGPTEALVPEERVRLGPGETQAVVLECAGRPTTLRVLGPSPRLLPHLALALEWQVQQPRGHGRSRWSVVQPAADGTIVCHLPAEPVRARIATFHEHAVDFRSEDGQFDLVPRGGELRIVPTEPVLGLVVEAEGRLVPSGLRTRADPDESDVRLAHVCTQHVFDAVSSLLLWSAPSGWFRIAVDRLRHEGDLRIADPRFGERMGTLHVVVAERSEPAARLDLLAEPLAGGSSLQLQRADERLVALLPAGDHRLVWRNRGGGGPVALERFTIRAGETLELRVAPPPLERWVMHLPAVPIESAHALFVKIGDVQGLGGARDGVFPIDLLEPPQLQDRAEVYSPILKARWPATVVAVDAGQRRATISSVLTDAVWVKVTAVPMGAGKPELRLQRAEGYASVLPAFLGAEAMVPLLPGQARDGCLVEPIDGRMQVVRWFRIEHGMRQLAVSGAGRWTTLRIERPVARACVLVEGPGAMDPVVAFEADRAGDYPLFVADGTRSVHVDVEPGGRQSFLAEAPLVVR